MPTTEATIERIRLTEGPKSRVRFLDERPAQMDAMIEMMKQAELRQRETKRLRDHREFERLR